jgi:hypothetical protein
MALQGCCQVFVTGVLLLVLIGPFAIVEAALCFIMGLIFGLFYWLTSCLWMSQAKQVRAKGCWLLREALLYAAAGISFAILPLTLVTLRGISRANKNFKFATIPTFVGFVDVNRFLAFKYFSCAPLTGASSFEGKHFRQFES